MIADSNIKPQKTDIKPLPDLAHLFRNLLVLGTPLSKPREFLTFGHDMPDPSLTPYFIDRMERGENYFWKCIEGYLYVDCGGHQYKVSAVSIDGNIWPIQERINYAERKVDGTIKAISEPTVILPDEEEFTIEVEEIPNRNNNTGILAVNGMYQQSGVIKPISPYYTYRARPSHDAAGNILINAPIPRGIASVKITEGKDILAFKNKLHVSDEFLHGISVNDPSQLGFGAIYVAIIPCDLQVKTAIPSSPILDGMFYRMSASSDLGPGSLIGRLTEGEQLVPRTSEASFLRLRVRTDLSRIPKGKYAELDTLLENLGSLTCRCTHCGREATKDVARVVISEEGVLQVEQVAPCQGCQARGWEIDDTTFSIEIKSDAEHGIPIPVCANCGGALSGASVGPKGEIINAPHECFGCRSTSYTVETVPVIERPSQ